MADDTDLAYQRKSAEVLLDFQWKSLVQTADLLTKGIGFYFLVLLGVTGAIFQSKINGVELRVAVFAIMGISVFVGVVFVALTWGIIQGLYELQRTVERINPTLYQELGFHAYFRRARVISRIVAIGCLLTLVVIVVVTFLLQYRQ